MESSSSSASVSSPPFEREHGVFISYHGETRNNFTSHVLGALKRNGVRFFADDKMKRGRDISSALLTAIRTATVSLIIFSENFATSEWCLMETEMMIECRRTQGQRVMPIFYRVSPRIVRKQIGSYGDALREHEFNNSQNLEKVKRWRTALRKAANLTGWHCGGDQIEYELVEEIAKKVMQRVNRKRNHILQKGMEIERACDSNEIEEVEDEQLHLLKRDTGNASQQGQDTTGVIEEPHDKHIVGSRPKKESKMFRKFKKMKIWSRLTMFHTMQARGEISARAASRQQTVLSHVEERSTMTPEANVAVLGARGSSVGARGQNLFSRFNGQNWLLLSTVFLFSILMGWLTKTLVFVFKV